MQSPMQNQRQIKHRVTIIILWIGGAALYFVGPGLQYSGFDKGEPCKAQGKTKGKLNLGLHNHNFYLWTPQIIFNPWMEALLHGCKHGKVDSS